MCFLYIQNDFKYFVFVLAFHFCGSQLFQLNYCPNWFSHSASKVHRHKTINLLKLVSVMGFCSPVTSVLIYIMLVTKHIDVRVHSHCGVTSGARYSGVPQKVFIVAPSVIPSLHSPKSVIFMWPSLSNMRFSNCAGKESNYS